MLHNYSHVCNTLILRIYTDIDLAGFLCKGVVILELRVISVSFLQEFQRVP